MSEMQAYIHQKMHTRILRVSYCNNTELAIPLMIQLITKLCFSEMLNSHENEQMKDAATSVNFISIMLNKKKLYSKEYLLCDSI